MYLVDTSACCGLDEINGLQDYHQKTPIKKKVVEFYEQWAYKYSGDEPDGPPVLIFTCVVKEPANQECYKKYYKIGDELTTLIRKNRLGTVHRGPMKRNPNSNNHIRGYLWTVNAAAFHKWAKKNGSDLKKIRDDKHYNPYEWRDFP